MLLTADELVEEGCELGVGGATEDEGTEEADSEDEGGELVPSLDAMSEDTSEDDSKDSCCEEDGACETLCDTCVYAGVAVLKTGLLAQEAALKHSSKANAKEINLFFIIKTSQIKFLKQRKQYSISLSFFPYQMPGNGNFLLQCSVSSCFFTVFMLKCGGFRIRTKTEVKNGWTFFIKIYWNSHGSKAL